MAAETSCTNLLLCKVAGWSAYLLSHPYAVLGVLLVVLLVGIGVFAIEKYRKEHGTAETAAKAGNVTINIGYYMLSGLKWLTMGSLVGVAAATFAFLIGIAHTLHHQSNHSAPTEQTSASASTQVPQSNGEANIKQTADASISSLNPVNASATTSTDVDCVDQAVRLAQMFPDRDIKVSHGNTTVVIKARNVSADNSTA